MNIKKLIFLPFIFFFLVNAYASNQTINNRSTELLKKIVIGIPTILLAHFGSEYITTGMHEFSHSLTNKAFTGDPIRLNVKLNRTNNPLTSILLPWEGVSFGTCVNNPIKENICIAAGPLAGIFATKIQMHFLEYCLGKMKNRSTTEINKRSLLQPFTLLVDLYHGCKELTYSSNDSKKTMRLSEFIISGIIFLRSARIIGETLYGFFPIKVPQDKGDGVRLWENLTRLNRPIKINLIGLTLLPFIGTMTAGVLSGMYKRYGKHSKTLI